MSVLFPAGAGGTLTVGLDSWCRHHVLFRMRLRRALTSLVYGVSLSGLLGVSSASHLDIPAGDLTSALELLARQAHVEFIYSAEDLRGLHTRGVNGDLTAEAALRKLIEGTGLTMSVHSSGAILIARKPLVDHPPGPPSSSRKTTPHSYTPGPSGVSDRQLGGDRRNSLHACGTAISGGRRGLCDPQARNWMNRAPMGWRTTSAFSPESACSHSGTRGMTPCLSAELQPKTSAAPPRRLIDEVPVGDASAITRGGLFTVDLDPTDLERVEVLKGPQRRPVRRLFNGRCHQIRDAGTGPDASRAPSLRGCRSDRRGSATGKLGVTASMPLIEGQLGVRISGYYRHSGGFIDDLGAGGPDTNRANDRGARATLLYRPVDNLTLKVTAMEQDDQAHGNDVVDYDLNTGRPVIGADAQYRYLSEPSKIRLQLYAAEVKYQLQHLEIVSATSYSSLRPVTIFDLTDSLTGLGLTGLPADARAASVYTEPVTKINQELRFVAARRGRLEWMLGGFFQRESADGSYLDRFYQQMMDSPSAGFPWSKPIAWEV